MNMENQIPCGIFMFGMNAGWTEEICQLNMAMYIKFINLNKIVFHSNFLEIEGKFTSWQCSFKTYYIKTYEYDYRKFPWSILRSTWNSCCRRSQTEILSNRCLKIKRFKSCQDIRTLKTFRRPIFQINNLFY